MVKAACVVNKFDTEAEAVEHAKAWSVEFRSEWTVIHGPSSDGLKFYAEPGDGGFVRNSERVVARFRSGRRLSE